MVFIYDLEEDLDKVFPKLEVYLEVLELYTDAIRYLSDNIVDTDQLTDYGKEQILWLAKTTFEEGTEECFAGHSDYAILYSILVATAEGITKNLMITPGAVKLYEDIIPRLQSFLTGSWVVRTAKQGDTTKEVS